MPVTNAGQNAQALAAHNNTVLYFDWFINSSGSLDVTNEDLVLSDFTLASETGYETVTIPLDGWDSDGQGIVYPKTGDPTITADVDWTVAITGALYHDGTDVWGWDYLRNPTTGSIISSGKLLVALEKIGAEL